MQWIVAPDDGPAVARHLNGRDSEQLFIMSNHYQIASELAFYVPGQPSAWALSWERARKRSCESVSGNPD